MTSTFNVITSSLSAGIGTCIPRRKTKLQNLGAGNEPKLLTLRTIHQSRTEAFLNSHAVYDMKEINGEVHLSDHQSYMLRDPSKRRGGLSAMAE